MAALLSPVAAAPLPIRLLGRLVDWTVIGIGSVMVVLVFVNVCLVMLLVLVLVRYGWSLVNGNWGNELTVLAWPMAVQYMGMAVGCTLMATFVAFDLWQVVQGVPRELRYPVAE